MTGLNHVAERAARYRLLLEVNNRVQTLETAEAVLRARVAVFDALLEARWQPPSEAVREHAADKRLLQERPGTLRG